MYSVYVLCKHLSNYGNASKQHVNEIAIKLHVIDDHDKVKMHLIFVPQTFCLHGLATRYVCTF